MDYLVKNNNNNNNNTAKTKMLKPCVTNLTMIIITIIVIVIIQVSCSVLNVTLNQQLENTCVLWLQLLVNRIEVVFVLVVVVEVSCYQCFIGDRRIGKCSCCLSWMFVSLFLMKRNNYVILLIDWAKRISSKGNYFYRLEKKKKQAIRQSVS